MENEADNLESRSKILGQRITQEILAAFGLPRNSALIPIIGKILQKPINRFSQIAALFDYEAKHSGLPGAAQKVLPYFPLKIETRRVDQIPSSGPLLILSNHPGAYDSLALVSAIPRKDLKLLVSDIPFSRALENARKNFIYVDFTAMGGMQALFSTVEALQKGDAVLTFVRGEVEPDPEFMPGADDTIDQWSSSIEILLRKVPQTQIVLTIVSGVFLPGFIHHPLMALRKDPAARQKLAEFLQLLSQLRGSTEEKAEVHISFSEFLFNDDLNKLMPELKKRARELLASHLQVIGQTPP